MKTGTGHSAGGSRSGQRRRGLDAGFDRWLERKLHELYDPVLEEEVPDELKRLLDAFDAGEKDGDGRGGGRP